VADAKRPGERVSAERGFEVREFADCANDFDAAAYSLTVRRSLPTRLRVHGESGRIVSAVFEAAQPIDENGSAIFGADVADDSAHSSLAFRQTLRCCPRLSV
jgi:hypothetical protein